MKDHAAPMRWIAEHDPLQVVQLTDPVIDALGHDARSIYVETYWTPVLGPTSLILLRRIAGWLETKPDGFPLPLGPTAAALGIGHRGGANSPMTRTLTRLVTFGMAAIQGDAYAVRRTLPPLARRHVMRLPGHLAERHRAESERPASKTLAASPQPVVASGR
ncbi:MAG TPA: hypothetical protein VK988_12420 [Acidimicrobiales bacterium]|nr:hypothetical protein [Acidimicrobiales bacterium]